MSAPCDSSSRATWRRSSRSRASTARPILRPTNQRWKRSSCASMSQSGRSLRRSPVRRCMMFRSILSKSLRDYRVPMLAWGFGLLVFMAVFVAMATPAVVMAYISLVKILSFWGDPYAMNTLEGYITFRWMETAWPILLSIWPILAGARLVRGEEERGTMDVLLATSQTRTRLLLEKVGALAIALLVIAVLFAVGVVVGEAALGGGHVDFVRALLAGLNLTLLAFFFGMVALLLSQLTTGRRAAASWTAGLLILF